MKTCPFCAEAIQDAAVVCPHCRRALTPSHPRRTLCVVLSVVAALGLLTILSVAVLIFA